MTQRKPLTRRIRRALASFLMAIALAVAPRLYMWWMAFTFKTSKVEFLGVDLAEVRDAYDGAIAVLWHEEVVTVSYAFQKFHAHTLASRGDLGELISRTLAMCNFTVFRGGSSTGRSRRSTEVLETMIERMQSRDDVIYGITVDGSMGPAYRMKKGACFIATACQRPIVLERTWFRRYFRLPTWDRTLVPLPFNHIVHVFRGPYLPPARDAGPEAIEAFRQHIEAELLELTFHTRGRFEPRPAKDRLRGYPEGWQPRWPPDPELALPFEPISKAG